MHRRRSQGVSAVTLHVLLISLMVRWLPVSAAPSRISAGVRCSCGRLCRLLSWLYCVHALQTSGQSMNACRVVSIGAVTHRWHEPSISMRESQLPSGRPSECRSHRNVLTRLGSHGCHNLLYMTCRSCAVYPCAKSLSSYLVGLSLLAMAYLYPCLVVYLKRCACCCCPIGRHCHSPGSQCRSSVLLGCCGQIEVLGGMGRLGLKPSSWFLCLCSTLVE